MARPTTAPEAQPSPPTARHFWHIYVTGWMLLAGSAVFYLVLAANNPDLARSMLPLPSTSPQQSNEGQRATTQLASEVQEMRSVISSLQSKLSAVSATTETQGKTVRAIVATVKSNTPSETYPSNRSADQSPSQTVPIRVTKVRTINALPQPLARTSARTSGARTKLPPLPTRVVRQPRSASLPGDSQAPDQIANQVKRAFASRSLPKNAAQPRILNRADQKTQSALRGASPVKTGSIPVPLRPRNATPKTAAPPKVVKPIIRRQPAKVSPIKFGPAIVKPTASLPRLSGQTAVTLSRAASLNGLRASWQNLAGRHSALLGGLQPRYSRVSTGGYRLLAGPLSDRVAADRLCSALRADGVACGVASYTGNAL